MHKDFLSKFTPEDLMHFAHIAKRKNLLGAWERSFFYNIGRFYWDNLSDKQEFVLLKIYKQFLSELENDFSALCKTNCTTCLKLTNELGTSLKENRKKRSKWALNIELYSWQKKYLREWLKQKKGILKIVTGAGKTIFALESISRITKKGSNKNIKVFIVVPTLSLVDQWREKLIEDLNVASSDIGIFSGTEWGKYLEDRIQIYTINSAREYLPIYHSNLKKKGFDTFLIADECHRYGSNKNSQIFKTLFPYDYTLGLSATPETYSHFGFENVLIPKLGNILLKPYTYSDALKDGIIPPFALINCKIKLSDEEQKEYLNITESIKRLSQKLGQKYPSLLRTTNKNEYFKLLGHLENEEEDEEIKKYKNLLNKRMSILHESQNRMIALDVILQLIENDFKNCQVIIFHERIKDAETIYDRLINKGLKVELYHSKLNNYQKQASLKRFKEGYSKYIICCKALDEGLDIPNASIGIIVSSTKAIRQRIQRIGRILRKAENKEFSIIFTIYVPEYESEIFESEEYKKIEGAGEVLNVDLTKINSLF